jgi:colanic acid/amylovoran biosynthesis glycosyltransferase
MAEVAVIVENFNLMPYFQSWSAAMVNTDLSMAFFSPKVLPSPSSYVSELALLPGKLGVLKSYYNNLLKWPHDCRNWHKQLKDMSLTRRIKTWAQYAPLLMSNPRIIHLGNSFLYPKYRYLINKLHSIAVTTFRGYEFNLMPSMRNELWEKRFEIVFHECDYLHFVSNYLRQEAINFGALPEKCFVIYPSIDTNLFRRRKPINVNAPSESLTLISVGRLVWEKGFQIALEAVQRLITQGHRINYWIVGSGVKLEELKYMSKRLGIQAFTKFFGYQSSDQIRSLLEKSDIYLQPSYFESLGIAALEASAMELPIIASNVGGLAEVVEHNFTGFLIPSNDSNALAEAIDEMGNNYERRLEIGRQGRIKVVREFSVEREVNDWLDLYGQVLKY